MRSNTISKALLITHALLGGVLAAPLTGQDATVRGYLADSTLALLGPMIGVWAPANLADHIDPEAVAQRYEWVVGGKAIRIQEAIGGGPDGTPQLEGMIYWNPATELVEFVAVAGHGDGQGRFFRGEYRLLENGAIERTYDVFYRTPADTPGETLGGLRRRYREVYTPLGDGRFGTRLDWFHDGAWRPSGRFATGEMRRLR